MTNIPTAALAHPMIAGLGFARMAWELAQRRTHGGLPEPMRRDSCGGPDMPSAEFYRITDAAWSIWLDGHQPITRIEL